MKNLLKLVGCMALLSAPTFADSITIGAPGNPLDGDYVPFGCARQYQQVYGSGLFSDSFTIGALTFFNKNFVPGSIAAANYTISVYGGSSSERPEPRVCR